MQVNKILSIIDKNDISELKKNTLKYASVIF